MALIALTRSHTGHYRPDRLHQKGRLCSARQGGENKSLLAALAFAAVFMTAACGKTRPPRAGQSAPRSQVTVSVNEAGPVIVASLQAEFDLLPSGYVQALLLKDGRELSLDEPGAAASFFGETLSSAGREIRDFSLDLAHPKVSDAAGRLGPAGKRMEITRHPESRTVRLTPEKEAYRKKWIDIYNTRMLSRGEFRNLFVCG
jgi:hypothetical protein